MPLAHRADAADVTVSLDQARHLAVNALNDGDPGLAIQLAKGLLKADPKDSAAYYIIATGYSRLNDPHLARRAAALSYRYSRPGPDRFHAAQLAAQMSYQSRDYTLSQLWLRRTAIHAPSEEAEVLVGRDYKLLRRVNPWSLRFRAQIRPSDNVNNGSDTALNTIDGEPDGFEIVGGGRALSGVIASLDVMPTYRLRATESSATTLGGRLYVERVSLSSEAQDIAPNATGSDFGSTYGELSLTHAFAAGPKESGGTAAVTFALGESWYGGERNYRFARLQGERNWRLGDATRFELNARAEKRFEARYNTNDAWILGLGGGVDRTLASGDVVSLTMALRDSDAERYNGTYRSASMRTSYTFAKALGPARLSLGLVLGYTRYDRYLGSVLISPKQRTDKSIYGDATLIFDRLDYAGFVPTLRLRTGRKNSNFSRFTSREMSLSLGIGSKF